jgi:nitroreductase
MQKRRSVRSYTGDPVPMEKLNLILEAGMLAPSGRAIRPWELIVIRDKQKLIDLSSCRMGGAARMLVGADLAIAVVGDEEKSDTWTEDCCVAMSYMMLMAEQLGVGSCWIQERLRSASSASRGAKWTPPLAPSRGLRPQPSSSRVTSRPRGWRYSPASSVR